MEPNGPAIEAELTHLNQEKASLIRQSERNAAIQPESSIIAVIARAASDPAVDMDKLERLLQMQERVMGRQAQMAFDADFSLMQTEMPLITQLGEVKFVDKTGAQHNTKYARFEDINEAIKPVMQKFGFSINFKVQTTDNKISVTGVLMHRQGHREETSMVLPADTTGSKNSVQSIGSSVSYGKRYTLCALLNITSKGEDTDAVVFISEEQALTLDTLIKDTKSDRARLLKYLGAATLEEIPATKYKDAIDALNIAAKALANKRNA